MLFFPNDIDLFESDMMIQFPNEDTVYALLSPHVTHIYMYICIWYGGRQKAVVQCSIKFSSIKSISFVDIFDDIFGDWVLTFDAILSCILLYFSDILICKDKKKNVSLSFSILEGDFTEQRHAFIPNEIINTNPITHTAKTSFSI